MTPDWEDDDAVHEVRSMCGSMAEIWTRYWESGDKVGSFTCWMPADEAQKNIDEGNLRDGRRHVARYLEAKALGIA